MSPGRFLNATGALFAREVTRFLRQPTRVVGALATPLVFWFFLGAGLGSRFQAGGGALSLNYLQFFLPGSMALVCVFSAMFSTISVIEDRQAGFLQGVLVSPAPRGAIALGMLSGGAALALAQSALFLGLAPAVGLRLTPGGVGTGLAILALMALGLTGLSFVLAWRSRTAAGFHAVMNLLLFPLWFLSGALFPLEGAPAWMRVLGAVNPVAHAVGGLQFALFGAGGSPALALGANALFAVLAAGAAAAVVRREGPR